RRECMSTTAGKTVSRVLAYNALQPQDVSFLSDRKTLYSMDFRAMSEDMTYDIPAMFKYENLLPWVLRGQHVCINDIEPLPRYGAANDYLRVPVTGDSRDSLY